MSTRQERKEARRGRARRFFRKIGSFILPWVKDTASEQIGKQVNKGVGKLTDKIKR